jgi:hypothetical protein
MPRPDTSPLFTEDEQTEPIILDTARRISQRRISPRLLVVVVPPQSQQRPKWADGVVPGRYRR